MKPITYLQNLPPIPKPLILIKSLLLFIMLSDVEQCQAQLSGALTVGSNVGDNYTSLTNVGGIFEDINTLGLSGDLSIEISSDLIGETGTVPLNQWSGGYKVQIVPSTTGIKTIYHSSCSSDLISLLGTDSLLIDGRYHCYSVTT